MRTVLFGLKGYERFGGWEHMPKRDLFTFAVNPYNGTVVLKYSDRRENALEVIDQILGQIHSELSRLRLEDKEASLDDWADYIEGKRELPDTQVVVFAPEVVEGAFEVGIAS